MKKLLLLIYLSLFTINGFSQKVINNPDCISKNISGTVTKVELSNTETVIHFHIKSPIGSWVAIPRETYIEDSSGTGERLYILKTEGISLTGKNYFEDSDEIRFKLFFPALPKDVKWINYGESNKGGNWFIYKLNLTKDGVSFLQNKSAFNLSSGINVPDFKENIVIGYPSNEVAVFSNNKMLRGLISENEQNVNTKLPKDLPETFFGSWYDKYGTLILMTTPDYIISNFRIQYYHNIDEIGDNKFKISSLSHTFEVLSLDEETMTIRTNRLMTLKRKPNLNKVPKQIKGDWLHWANVKEIKITDDYFYINDHGELGVYEIEGRIDKVIESGNAYWFVIYKNGNYDLYGAREVDGEFVMQPKGFVNAKYKKVKN
ncbi:hypothetical protein N1F78_02625 [Seonamhaeicola sp. MEBiC1930]|uniref:hypothetical protein n=1 Tax=Seonamhaeicola sp. MEBiC01930 TaxID=2976768 RepID=UPI00325548E6